MPCIEKKAANFKRRRVVSPYVVYQWDKDTVSMEYYKKNNNGYAYFLLDVDILSNFVWTVTLRMRAGKEMVQAFKQIFRRRRIAIHIRSDKWTKFAVTQFFKKEGVNYFVTQNVVKASYAERAIKTSKSRLPR